MTEAPGGRSSENSAPDIRIQKGFAPEHRREAAKLFWNAFSGKLGKILAPEDKALRFIENILGPDCCLSAITPDGDLLGLAGFKTSDGAFSSGGLADLQTEFGTFGGLWRGLLLSLLERKIEPGEFLMDGIFVHPDARGQGIGTLLMEAVFDEARRRGDRSIRLDVIDTNPRARKLYESLGFQVVSIEKTEFLSGLFGFKSAARMVKTL